MPENSASSLSRGVEITVFIIGTIGVILSALFFSALGSFLSFAGADGEPRPFFNLIMVTAVYGPYGLAALAVILGATSFWGRRGMWAIPLLGVLATGALYLLCAFAIA